MPFVISSESGQWLPCWFCTISSNVVWKYMPGMGNCLKSKPCGLPYPALTPPVSSPEGISGSQRWDGTSAWVPFPIGNNIRSKKHTHGCILPEMPPRFIPLPMQATAELRALPLLKDLTIPVSFLLSTTALYNGNALDIADHQAPEGTAVINISIHHEQNICFCH